MPRKTMILIFVGVLSCGLILVLLFTHSASQPELAKLTGRIFIDMEILSLKMFKKFKSTSPPWNSLVNNVRLKSRLAFIQKLHFVITSWTETSRGKSVKYIKSMRVTVKFLLLFVISTCISASGRKIISVILFGWLPHF